MKVNISIQSEQLSKEDLQLLLQYIRDCEQKNFPDKEIHITIDAPDMSAEEIKEILTEIKPPLKYGPFTITL